MLLKMLLSASVCAIAYLLGRSFADDAAEKLSLVRRYAALAHSTAGQISFSGKSVFELWQSVDGLPFAGAICARQDVEGVLHTYTPQGEEEAFCIERLRAPLLFAQSNSDAQGVADGFLQAEKEINDYLKQKEEALNGKIRTVPAVSLAAGVLAVIVLL